MADNSTSDSSSSYDDILGMVLSKTIKGLFAAKDAKLAQSLIDKLSSLTLAQKQALHDKLVATHNQTEQYSLIYKALAVQNNQSALQALDDAKNKNILYISIGISLLGLLVILKKIKHHE